MNISKQIKQIKNLMNEDNKTILIGLLTILSIFWLLFDAIPILFVSLFNTILGNIILLITVILISLTNYKYGLLIGIIFIVLVRFAHLSSIQNYKTTEGFQWDSDSTIKYLRVQSTINRDKIFDTEQQQKQASQEELNYFLAHGMWPWSKEVQLLYEAHIMNNPYVQSYSKDSIIKARTIYTQAAILELLSLQAKEGQFIMNGVEVNSGLNMMPDGAGSFGYHSNLITNMYNPIIKCGLNKKTGKNELKKIQYVGDDKIFGSHSNETKNIDINKLENIIPGFKFIDEPCDPCSVLDDPPSYNCKFHLNIKGNEGGISEIWKYLWGIKDDSLYTDKDQNKEINANKFKLPEFNK